MKRFVGVWLVLLCLLPPAANADSAHQRSFEQAIELVHAYSGAGNELNLAMETAQALVRSAPKSGYGQTIMAEKASTWDLSQDGRPEELRKQILALCDQAIALNPELAQAHVAKARTLLRASLNDEARASIDAALRIEPKQSGALFLNGELHRRAGNTISADLWYRKFIDSTSSPSRKSNGYAWIAQMYRDAMNRDPANRDKYISKARDAYESMVKLEPNAAWKTVNYAIFLNYIGDFPAAEQQAQRALRIMEFPMARYHLAAARYLQLNPQLSVGELQKAVDEVAWSTRVTLDDAVGFDSFGATIRQRLTRLRQALPPGEKTQPETPHTNPRVI